MPHRFFLSSGDLIADRRYEFARDLQLKGDLAAAAEVMEQAIEVAPNFASAWFELGQIRIALGETDKAITAFQNACAADPDDRHGAGVRLMQLGAAPLSDMPKAYVRSLFDQYAPRFEAELIERLNYRAPAILFKAVLAVRVAEKKPAYFQRAIDLGCGTGLGAAAFAKNVDSFIGIDLSAGMIAQARETGLYAALEVDDMTAGLQRQPDHVRIRTMDLLNVHRRPPLDGITARLAHRFSRRDITRNLRRGHRSKLYRGHRHIRIGASAVDPRHPRAHLVPAPGEKLNDVPCIGGVLRLAEYVPRDHHRRIRAEHGVFRIRRGDGLGLGERIVYDRIARRRLPQRLLGPARHGGKARADLAQQIPPARRSGCKNKHEPLLRRGKK